VELRADQKSVASTSLDRSAANLALMVTVVAMVVLLGLVNQTPATTVLHVSHATTARALPASVSRDLQVLDVSTRTAPLTGRLPQPPADLDNVSTVADVKRQPTGLQDVSVYRRGLDDIVR